MATNNSKFVVKNGLAVGSPLIDVINTSGEWIGATGTLHGATGPQGNQGASGISGASGYIGLDGASGINGLDGATGQQGASGVSSTSSWISAADTDTLLVSKKYLIDTSLSAISVALAPSPSFGDEIMVADNGDFSINNLTIGANGNTINSAAEDLLVDIKDVIITLVYNGTTWKTHYQYWNAGFSLQGDLNILSGSVDLSNLSGTYDLQS